MLNVLLISHACFYLSNINKNMCKKTLEATSIQLKSKDFLDKTDNYIKNNSKKILLNGFSKNFLFISGVIVNSIQNKNFNYKILKNNGLRPSLSVNLNRNIQSVYFNWNF